MRVVSKSLAAIAVIAFATAPAMACPWNSAKSEKMTVADVPMEPDGDVSIATNDLSDEALKKLKVLPAEKPEDSK
ncbi:hypothetical protein [Roseibium sp. TrichSKD4]|uniref:hypothetical protein n=1 Tax=Roseibium sp. TrichSKD4 TaxID=744980 RepID=UPI001112C77B|nr:hypothetical protein [Roseibium sp. TrichSKD4]